MVSVEVALRTVDWEGVVLVYVLSLTFFSQINQGKVQTYCEQIVRNKIRDLALLLNDKAPHDIFGGSRAEQVLDLGV
jgi:hypothetical protein